MVSTNVELVVVAPDSEIGLTLKAAQASGNPVIVDTGEARYTLLVAMTEPAPDLFAGYDPQAAVAGLRALSEAFAGVDREALLRDLRAQRDQNSLGRLAWSGVRNTCHSEAGGISSLGPRVPAHEMPRSSA